jgi:hypothetical protein
MIVDSWHVEVAQTMLVKQMLPYHVLSVCPGTTLVAVDWRRPILIKKTA